jgi:flagellar hook-associated protein 1 FlgK
MSGLFGSLSSGVRALTAQSRAVETAGRNLANVNNPHYARQRVVLGDRGTVFTPEGAQSLGLEALQIQQLRDVLLDRQTVREIAATAALDTEAAAYERAQAGLGQQIGRTGDAVALGAAGSGNGLAESITAFFNAFQAFAARPTDLGERQSLVQQASALVDRVRTTDQRLEQVQTDLTEQISTDVEETNRLLETIADLNRQIGRAEINFPGGAADLRDQRQARLEELAAKLPCESRPASGYPGQLQISVRDTSGAEVVLVAGPATTGPVTLSGGTVTGGAANAVIAVPTGGIGGALVARDTVIAETRSRIDRLAEQFVRSVNAAYNPTGTTGDFFGASGVAAASFALAPGVSATSLKASDGGAVGDTAVARAVAALGDRRFSVAAGDVIDGTFLQHFTRTATDLGQALAGARARADDQRGVEQIVRGQRDAVSGVSLDEEMADLMRYQRSFQASSRVVAVIDELLETVVNRLGA